MVGMDVDIEAERKLNRGPVCAECAKPFKVPADKGGCDCPRHSVRPEAVSPKLLAADRQAAALEAIWLTLEKILERMEGK